MNSHYFEALHYERDSAQLVRRLHALDGFVFLDSGLGDDRNGRYDILSALPEASVEDSEDYYDSVQSLLAQYAPDSPLPQAIAQLPFVGGAIGYLGYDNCARIGIYTWAIVVDHAQQRTSLFVLAQCSDARRQQVQQCLASAPPNLAPFKLTSPFESNFTRAQYAQAFARIQDYIHAGDCYQVNLAQRFQTHYNGSPLTAYLALRESIHCPFAGFMSGPSDAVLSFSPERFVQIREGKVLTQPIKGTRPRSQDPEQDQALAWLLHRRGKRLEKLIGEGWDSTLSMRIDRLTVAEGALSWESPYKEKNA